MSARSVQDEAAAAFHRLTVKAVREETPDARSFVLVPDAGEEALYHYRPGQFLTFRVPHEEGEILRSYSLSSAPCSDPDLTVCVKRVAEGRGSNWFNDRLIPGARIMARPPAGRFVLRASAAPLLLIAGGSGITPCISLVKQALFETERRVKLVYANRDEASVIYRDQLTLMEQRFAERFTCQHWLDNALGFMTPIDITGLAKGWEGAESYVCGPDPLMSMAEETLANLFGPEAVILTERFVSPEDTPLEGAPQAGGEAVDSYRVTLDGEDHSIEITAGQTLLEAALAAGIDVPNSCTEGHCGTCMSQLKSGEVSMASTRALSKRNLARGYVLACQARPTTADPIWLDFDF
ncbi:MAG: ferredoxin--NADP reductase [Kiloniellales bacterium]